MITVEGLTKHFGAVHAVTDLSFQVNPGLVTGFLGPNGSGKSTTMRMIVGLDVPTAGRALVNGVPYNELHNPLRHVGALLDAKWIMPKRSGRNHLRWMAAANGIAGSRVDEVLHQVGLLEVARRPAGGYSLGMSQRLGLAAAMLGDPGILIFDEPVNGLDPEGIVWVRNFIRARAAEGRAVLVSSHLLTEMSLTADHLIVIGRGTMLADASVAEFSALAKSETIIRTPDVEKLSSVLRNKNILFNIGPMTEMGAGPKVATFAIPDLSTEVVGSIAFAGGVQVYEISERRASLEDVFMQLTNNSVEYRGSEAFGNPTQQYPAQQYPPFPYENPPGRGNVDGFNDLGRK